MGISNYTDLKTAIGSWLKRDLSASSADFITLAEADFRRQLVMPEMETTVTVSGSNPISLPSDLDSIRIVVSPDINQRTLRAVSPSDFYNLRASGGRPEFYMVNGSKLSIWPAPEVGAPFTLLYRATVPSLSSTVPTNWLLAAHPDAYLFGSLLQAEFFGWNDERLPMIQAKLASIIEDINTAGNRKRYSGPLVMRSPVVETVRHTQFMGSADDFLTDGGYLTDG